MHLNRLIVMYSKNDYRYYLEHHMITGDYLAHYGVEGMHWGIRRYQPYSTVPRKSGEGGKETGLARKRSRLEQKKASNEVKIEKYKNKLNDPKIQAKKLKAKKYELSNQKLEASGKIRGAKKALKKTGGNTPIQKMQLSKYERNKEKAARLNRKADILQTKIDTLEYKNTKIDKKLGKINSKLTIASLKEDIGGKAVISTVGGPGKVNYTDGSTGDHANTSIKSTNGATIVSDFAGGFGKTKKMAQLDSDIRAYKHITRNNKSGRTRNKSAQMQLEKSIRKRIDNDEAFDRIMNAKSDKERHSEMYDAGIWEDRKRR